MTLFFAIQLDEEQIVKDRIINLDAAYRIIEKTFAQKDVTLERIEKGIRYFTRNIDEHDFEYLWMVNGPFRYKSWFQYYVKVWKYIETPDEDSDEYYEEDLLDEEECDWYKRPERP